MSPDTQEALPALTLSDYLAILRRRRAIVLQAFLLIAVVGVVVTCLAKPVYQASAKLLVEGPSYNLNTVDTNNPLSALVALGQQQTVETQVEVLQAQPLLDQVTRQAGTSVLTVAAVKDTNVIEATAQASDPKIAANSANLLLDLYVSQDADQNLQEIIAAKTFVEQQGTLARHQLHASERALQVFQQTHHVADVLKSRDEQASHAAVLIEAVHKAQANLAALHAQDISVQQQLTQEPSVLISSLPATNPERAMLQSEIGQKQVEREGLVQPGGFTSQAPTVRALDAQIAELHRRLDIQPSLAITQSGMVNQRHEALLSKREDLKSQASALAAEARTDQAQIVTAQAQMSHFPRWEVEMARLTRAHEEAEASDRMFTDKLAELSLREKARHVGARVIERAQIPTAPVQPQKARSIIITALFGLLVGLCLALLQEFLDDRVNTQEDAVRVTGLTALGRIPVFTKEDPRLLPEMPIWHPVSEGYRTLRTNLRFASIDAPTRTLLITSSGPGEGKTTTAVNLAFAQAFDGKRVILVDTDLRRPALHTLLEMPLMPGLTDVLLQRATLEEALHEIRDSRSPHDGTFLLLTCGATPPNPSELLGSRVFHDLVARLIEQTDLVIFDSPPILAAADAQILASQMDGVALVLETGATRKAAARQSVGLLSQARATLLGFVSNKTVRSQEGDYYAYYHYGSTDTRQEKEGPISSAEK